MKKIIMTAISPILLFWGYLYFKIWGSTPKLSFKAFRHAFVVSNGKYNDLISNIISFTKKTYNESLFEGGMLKYSEKELTHIVNEINQNGYYIFKDKLPNKTIEEIYDFALTTPVRFLDTNLDKIKYSEEEILFNEEELVSPRYQFREEQILASQNLQRLIFDNSILHIAQKYLKSKPILTQINLWWSAPFSGKGKSAAAQMYHFDMSWVKFLKFFFYVTDVDTNNGPHCYVKGSHKKLPKALKNDRRFTDDEILKHYGKEKMIEIIGKSGTIIAVDTRGIHKGKELIQGKRLLLQLEFANTLYGEIHGEKTNFDIDSINQSNYKKFKYTYQKYSVH